MIVTAHRIGTELNPIAIDAAPTGATIDRLLGPDGPHRDRPYVWCMTPDGGLHKLYRSYGDYCAD